MASITVRQFINTYFELKLGKKYQSHDHHDRLEKVCVDILANFGIEVSLNNKEKQTSFLALILHAQDIIKQLKATIIKNRKKYSIESVFPNPEMVFYSEAKYPDANFIVVQPHSR